MVNRILTSRVALATATALGRAARLALVALNRAGLSVGGLALVALGLWLAWPPLGVIAAGLALLWTDWGRGA